MTHQQAVETLASERYMLDEMSEVERHAFESHYFACAACAEEVRLGELIRAEARLAGPAAESLKPVTRREVTPRPVWRRPSILLPWAAAATLAAVASYQSFVAVPAFRQAMAAQPLVPVMLRGATRGAAPVIMVSPGQSFITIGADVDAEPAVREIEYDLLDSSRATLLSGRAAVPPAGVPLLLLIPVVELDGAGRHTLIVRNVDGGAAAIGEYDFDVSY